MASHSKRGAGKKEAVDETVTSFAWKEEKIKRGRYTMRKEEKPAAGLNMAKEKTNKK